MIKKVANRVLNSSLFLELLLNQEKNFSPHIYFVKVNPKKISHISIIPENSYRLSGPEAVYGSFNGYFDLIKRPFERHFMYRTVEQLMNGKDWSSTPYFKKLLKRNGKAMALEQLEKLENLIETLSNEGYLSQYQLGSVDITQTISQWRVPRHEIVIGMDRKGNLFRIKGGRHRLAIAQNIGIRTMPAILTLYHKNTEDNLPKERRIIIGDSKDFRPF